MRRSQVPVSGIGEDVTEKAGWMYADLFLALMVIFLATISFVPNTRTAPPGNTPETPQVSLNSINMTSGMADLYTKFDPEQMKADIEKFKELEHKVIPTGYDYDTLTSLSSESREKLKKIKPHSIGQASRIPGVSPTDISLLVIDLKR